MFSKKEVDYLNSNRLARIATVSSGKQPDVTPVGFRFDGERFVISGQRIEKTRKYKNVRKGDLKVGLVIDDLESVSPWKPRAIKIYGIAEIENIDGRNTLVIKPPTHWSWGIETEPFDGGKQVIRKVEHEHS